MLCMAGSSRLWILIFTFVLAIRTGVSAQDAPNLCKNSRPDCAQAVAFFVRFQLALKQDHRDTIAAMARYPLRVRLNGKSTVLHNSHELLQNYSQIFDHALRCSIQRAKKSEIWDNWQGFTISHGEVWWERSSVPNSRFKLITVNNEAYYPGCGTGNHE